MTTKQIIKSNKRIFYDWAEANDCKKAFIANVIRQRKRDLSSKPTKTDMILESKEKYQHTVFRHLYAIILEAFVWRATPEGEEHWSDLDDKWDEYINTMGI